MEASLGFDFDKACWEAAESEDAKDEVRHLFSRMEDKLSFCETKCKKEDDWVNDCMNEFFTIDLTREGEFHGSKIDTC